MDKAQLRRHFRSHRKALKESPQAFAQACLQLAEQVRWFLKDLSTDSYLFSYRAFGSEAPVPSIEGYRWCYPRMRSEGEMDFYQAHEAQESHWIQHSMGILEPSGQVCEKVDGEKASVVFVPGVAFDREGFRLGGGLGFYDRFLASLKKEVLKIGVGFHVQLSSEKLPVDSWDVRLDGLITEKGTIHYL